MFLQSRHNSMRKKKQQQGGGAHHSVEERECLTIINSINLHHKPQKVFILTCVSVCVCPVCALCRLSDDDPALFGDKVMLREHGFSIHYFCLVRYLHTGENTRACRFFQFSYLLDLFPAVLV